MKHFEGKIIVINSANLCDSPFLCKILDLVTRVYDKEHADTFLYEMNEDSGTIIVCMVLGDDVVALGCIAESHISFGVYELFWGMVDERYRGNGWGKILIDERIKHVVENMRGKSTPTDVIVVTTKPWHLERCGFEILRRLNEEELLMYCKVSTSPNTIKDIRIQDTFYSVEGNILYPDKSMLTWGPFHYHDRSLAIKRMDAILKDITDWCNLKDPSLYIEPTDLIRTRSNDQIVFRIKAWKDESTLQDCEGIIQVNTQSFED